MSLKTLSNVKLGIEKSEKELLKIAERSLGRKAAYFAIKKKSLDAREKHNVKYVYTIEFSDKPYQEETPLLERLPLQKLPQKPVLVVGSGPAGLFCALRLLDRGILPIVIERGPCVEEREQKINLFFNHHVLDTEGNIQFGEGAR